MLPLPLQFIIAMVAYAINRQMDRRIEYLLEEVRVLREVYTETTGRKRISFTDEQRRRLAVKGKALTPEERKGCCQVVRPTVRSCRAHEARARHTDSTVKRTGIDLGGWCTVDGMASGSALHLHARHLVMSSAAAASLPWSPPRMWRTGPRSSDTTFKARASGAALRGKVSPSVKVE